MQNESQPSDYDLIADKISSYTEPQPQPTASSGMTAEQVNRYVAIGAGGVVAFLGVVCLLGSLFGASDAEPDKPERPKYVRRDTGAGSPEEARRFVEQYMRDNKRMVNDIMSASGRRD